MLRTFLRRACAALGLSLALVAAPAPAKTARPARPALWAVSDADTTIYLFGTIHLLPDKYQWRTAKFDQAIEGSQQLVVETIVDNKNPQKLMAALASLAFNTPNLPPLAQRVPPAKRAALAAAIKKSGYPPQALDKMETWAAAITLLGNQFKDMGLKGDEGVETVLRNTFTSEGKPIGELESNVEQLGFFDKLPESAQEQLLEGSIDDPKSVTKEFQGMLTAWVARRRPRNRRDVQPRPLGLARAQAGTDQAAQRQLEQVDRAENDAAGRDHDRRRSGPSRRPRFGHRSARAGRLPRPPRPIADARTPLMPPSVEKSSPFCGIC